MGRCVGCGGGCMAHNELIRCGAWKSKPFYNVHQYNGSCGGAGTTRFLPGACERVENFLTSRIVGQDLAMGQIIDAVCTHIDVHRDTQQVKPLVLSVHGPPGVGKTFSHTLLARALYNKDPAAAVNCPGTDCMGAKVEHVRHTSCMQLSPPVHCFSDYVLSKHQFNTFITFNTFLTPLIWISRSSYHLNI